MRYVEDRSGPLQPGDMVGAEVYKLTRVVNLEVLGIGSFKGSQEPAVELIRTGYVESVIIPLAVVVNGGYYRPSVDTLVRFVPLEEPQPVSQAQQLGWRRVIETIRRRTNFRSWLRGF